MTAAQAAKKWGVSVGMVWSYLLQGRVPGAYQANGNAGKWHVPDDAQKTARKNARRISKVVPAMTQDEKEAYIRRFCFLKTYGELSAALGLTTAEVRDIYERLHALYGV